MNQREKRLLLITLVILVIGGVFWYTGQEDLETTDVGEAANFDDAQMEFEKIMNVLDREEEINRGFEEIDDGLRDTIGDSSHRAIFQNELYGLLTTQLKVPTPKMTKARGLAIDNVSDYYFVELEFSASGSRQEMTKLITELESRGLIVNSCEMTRRKSDEVDLTVVVARLFKHNDQSRAYMERIN